MKKEFTLFVGNGLNRCFPDGIPWGDILRSLAEKYRVEYNSSLPMPMEFERIINVYSNTIETYSVNFYKDVYSACKEDVAKIVDSFKPDLSFCIHNRIKEIPIDNIITTNYDLILEEVLDIKEFSPKATSVTYLRDRTNTNHPIKIYHPHGMIINPKSICLGFDHYIRIVQDLRTYLNADNRIIKKLKEEREFDDIWGEKFYTTDMAIIGFGLPDCETDIWWLLTHRASIYYANVEGARNLIQNRIIYYDIIDRVRKANPEEEKSRVMEIERKKNLYSMLENLHVEVCYIEILNETDTYPKAYERIFDKIYEFVMQR